MKKTIIPFLAIMFVFSLNFADPIENAVAAEPIKVGAVLNFTGPAAMLGPLFKNGIVMAFEEHNNQIAGRPLELIVEDGATDATTCLEKVRKLVERDKVKIIIGPLMGDAHVAIAPYIKNKKVLITTLYCGTLDMAKDRNWLIYPTTLVGLTVPVGWYAHDSGHRTMVMITSDYAGGHGFMNGVRLGFEQKGGKIVQEVFVPVGTADFGPYISTLKDADCVSFFVPNTGESSRLITQYREFGVKMPLYGTTLASDLPEPVMKELGDKVIGLQGQAAYVWSRDDPINNKWVAAMKKRFGQIPGGLESNSYAITSTILTALESTGGDESFDKLWPAAVKVKLNTPQGKLSYTPDGVAITDGYIVEAKVKDGMYVWDPIKVYPQVLDPRIKK
ncbi:MAG: ABC transporter substrate-binding protein [Desulfobacterales bacterium]|nr:MAG: ABC transporter substrate-binding protein [Desulfobacterales bacterium]